MNGWSNYPTFIVSQFFDTEIEELVKEIGTEDLIVLSRSIKELVKDQIPEHSGIVGDILDWAVEQVRWLEIAKSRREK
ncbi:MAG: hypothetical protein ACK421_07685 [Pseudanabaenaceae cyanobacterium]